MGKGRTIASIVALVLIVGLLGACGSSSKSKSAATRTAAQAKAAQAKIAAAKQRLAAAQLRVARQRRALAIAVRRRQLQARIAARAATSTTTTTPRIVAPAKPTTPTAPARVAVSTTTTPPAIARPADLAADTVAIARTLAEVNAGFAKSVAAGIAASEAANYYISAGIYTDGECSAFEAAQGLGVVSDRLVLQPGSVVAAPGFVDPILGAVPPGRVYALTMQDIQTLVSTQAQRTRSVSTHATVQPDGRALLFLRCK